MARSNEPLVWALFSGGMMLGSFLLPALILITGILLPFGLVSAEGLQALLQNWLVRLLLLALIALTFFHWAHRFKFTLVDIGLKSMSSLIGVVCYGLAIAGTLVTVLVALGLV